MIDRPRRQALSEELLRRLGAAVRGAQLYAPGHPLVSRAAASFCDVARRLLAEMPSLSVALVADEVVIGDAPVPRGAAALGELFDRMKARGIERITIESGVDDEELGTLVATLIRRLQAKVEADVPFPDLPHIRVGLVRIGERLEASIGDASRARQMYAHATGTAERLWAGANDDGVVRADEALALVGDLERTMDANRDVLLAITSMRATDTYTFTHMVNVSILTMAQARGLGLEGRLLQEFGMAGLLHDIGKVRLPPEVLNKPDRLDDRELALMRQHPVDGAAILRRTPDLPTLVPIVAFEHHLRADGSGYPVGANRRTLNLATTLCSIADVFDAMRSKRQYQQAFPSERILAVLQRNQGREFEPNLVRRFVQLMGIYPTGTVVRLNTGEHAVVTRPCPLDPHRPRVRVVFAPDGQRLTTPYDLDLWDLEPDPRRTSSVAGPGTAPDPGFDALTALQ